MKTLSVLVLLFSLVALPALLAQAEETSELDSLRAKLVGAQQSGELPAIAEAQRQLALEMRKLGALDEALDLLVEAEQSYLAAGMTRPAIMSMLERADTHNLQGDYDRALALNYQAVEWFQDNNDLEGQARVNSNLGLTHYRLDDSERAIEHFEHALALYRSLEDDIGIARQLNAIGVMYKNRGQYQQALDAYEQSMRIRLETGDISGMGDLYNNMAVVAWEQGDLETTLEYHQQALALRQEHGSVFPIAQSQHNIGYTLMEMERWEEARAALNSALELTEGESSIRTLARVTRQRLGLLEEQLGNYQAALEHARAEMELREQMMDESRQRDVAAMRARFESAQTERELALLQQQQIHDQEQLVKDRRLRNMAFFGLIGVVLILFLLFSRYRMRVQSNNEISAKNDELETLDRIVSTINRESDLRELLTQLLKQALGFFQRADKGAVLLLDRHTMHYAVVAHRGYRYRNTEAIRLDHQQVIERYTGSGREISSGVWLHSQLPGIPEHPDLATADPAASLVAMLLNVGESIEGVLVLQSDNPERAFGQSDAGKFARLRSHAISAVTKMRQMDQLREQRRLAEHAMEKMASVQKELEQAARTDPLTNLPNRRAMSEQLSQECVRSLRSKSDFVVILTDVDFFKRVNDTYGHEAGDDVLVEVSRRLRSMLRGQDTVARWGGEEFLILLPETGLTGGRLVAEKLRCTIADVPIAHRDIEIDVRMTFGVAVWLRGEDVERTIARADEALYRGKEGGRNRVVLAEEA